MAKKRTTRCAGDGFTLLEILLGVAFVSLVAILPLAFTRLSLARHDLRLTEALVVSGLQRAQFFSIAQMHGGAWGAKIEEDRMTLFQGDSFDVRTVEYDEVLSFPNAIAIAGIDEVTYARFSGEPNGVGEITLGTGESALAIVVTPHGFLEY
jgi:type II secretory pathway pseudopilin PulG